MVYPSVVTNLGLIINKEPREEIPRYDSWHSCKARSTDEVILMKDYRIFKKFLTLHSLRMSTMFMDASTDTEVKVINIRIKTGMGSRLLSVQCMINIDADRDGPLSVSINISRMNSTGMGYRQDGSIEFNVNPDWNGLPFGLAAVSR